MTDALFNEVAAAWREAGQSLGIRIVAPHTFEHDGRSHLCVAYVPDFGSPKGTAVSLTMAQPFGFDSTALADAQAEGFHCTLLNPDFYARFDRNTFVETIADWGYFGAPEEKPSWCKPPTA